MIICFETNDTMIIWCKFAHYLTYDMIWHEFKWSDIMQYNAMMDAQICDFDKGWSTWHLFVLRTTSRRWTTAVRLSGSPFTRDRTHKSMYQKIELWRFLAFRNFLKERNMCLNFELPKIPWIILNYHETSIHLYQKERTPKTMISSTSKLLKLNAKVQNLAFSEAWSTCQEDLCSLIQSTDCWAVPTTGISGMLRYALPAPCGT